MELQLAESKQRRMRQRKLIGALLILLGIILIWSIGVLDEIFPKPAAVIIGTVGIIFSFCYSNYKLIKLLMENPCRVIIDNLKH